jgi:hypothetical protein
MRAPSPAFTTSMSAVSTAANPSLYSSPTRTAASWPTKLRQRPSNSPATISPPVGCPGCPTADPPRLTNGVIRKVTVGNHVSVPTCDLG